LRAGGWRIARLGAIETVDPDAALEGVDAVVVDRVGVLAHLYSVGTAAYVGGGFHGQGLHSVLEPAAMGIPVLFGPRFGNSLAAGELVRGEGGVSAADGETLARTLLAWFTEPEEGAAAGARARNYLQGHRGAAARTVEALLPLLSPPPGEGPGPGTAGNGGPAEAGRR
jgi:3-deoxy-D-manno-octulosonic-acid transferase